MPNQVMPYSVMHSKLIVYSKNFLLFIMFLLMAGSMLMISRNDAKRESFAMLSMAAFDIK